MNEKVTLKIEIVDKKICNSCRKELTCFSIRNKNKKSQYHLKCFEIEDNIRYKLKFDEGLEQKIVERVKRYFYENSGKKEEPDQVFSLSSKGKLEKVSKPVYKQQEELKNELNQAEKNLQSAIKNVEDAKESLEKDSSNTTLQQLTSFSLDLYKEVKNKRDKILQSLNQYTWLDSVKLSLNKNYFNSILTNFWEKMENTNENERLDNQKKRFGRILKKPFPMDSNNHFHFQFMDHIGKDYLASIWKQFKTSINAKNQENSIIALVQTSGAGKTKLGYSIGTYYTTVCMINIIMGGTLSRPVKLLCEVIQNICKGKEDKFIAAKESLNAVRLFILAYLWWIKFVLGNNQHISQRRRIILELQENGVGEEGVYSLLSDLFLQVGVNNEGAIIEKFVQFNIWFKKNCEPSEPLVIFYDEIAEIKGLCPGAFYHRNDFINKIDLSRNYEETKKKPDPDSSYTQLADLFYALRLVMLELTNKFSWIQIFASTKFSICDISQLEESSPTRSRIVTCHLNYLFKSKDMVTFLEEQFGKFESSKRVENYMNYFIGRPLFFVNYFIPELLEQCESKKYKRIEDLFADLKHIVSKAFKEGVLKFSKNVLKRYISDKHIPLSALQFKSIQQMVYEIYFHLRCRGGVIRTNEPEAIKALTTAGLLYYSGDDDNQILLNTEPLFVQAIYKTLDNRSGYIFTMLRTQLDHVNPKLATKGYIAEDILAWYFVSTSLLQKEGCLLKDIIYPLLNKKIHFPSWLNEAKVYLEFALPMGSQEKEHFKKAFGKIPREDKLLYQLHNVVGPDLLIPFHLKDKKGLLVIQSKARETLDVKKAISSLSWERFGKFLPSNFSAMHYVKAVFSVKSFDFFKKFETSLNQLNDTSDYPIFILDDIQAFPEDVCQTLKKTCSQDSEVLRGIRGSKKKILKFLSKK